MKLTFILRLLISIFTLAFAAIASQAQEEVISGTNFFEHKSGPWDFGIDLGLSYPTHGKNFNHTIGDARVYDLLGNEPAADEIAEGFNPPPITGHTPITSSMRSTADFGMHLYHQYSPTLWFGADIGWAIKRAATLDATGLYVKSNFLSLQHDVSILHFNFPFKLITEYAGFRPYLLGGPGAYIVMQRMTIDFVDPDDPVFPSQTVYDNQAIRFGFMGGAGIERKIGNKGILGFELIYHKLFSSYDRLDFVVPRLRFSVSF